MLCRIFLLFLLQSCVEFNYFPWGHAEVSTDWLFIILKYHEITSMMKSCTTSFNKVGI